jgi:hypothetical protein
MQKCQFSELQYGVAINTELYQGTSNGFFPTQPVENHIGFDGGFDVSAVHRVWDILRVNIPRRIFISAMLWPRLRRSLHADIPGRYCSLFFQFKRPKFQDSRRAKHWRAKGDYYEIGISKKQRKVLQAWEVKVGDQAVVRYASPAFWSNDDFEIHDGNKKVLENSTYLAPAAMKSHLKWMFTKGPSGCTAFFNPDFEEGQYETWKTLASKINEALRYETTLRDHVSRLATTISGTVLFEPNLERFSMNRISQYMEASQEDIRLLYDSQVIARAAFELDLDWIVVTQDGGKYSMLPRRWERFDPIDWRFDGF